MSHEPSVEPSRARRRGWASVVAVTVVAVVAALLQADPVERLPYFVEHEPANIAHAGAQGHAPQNTIPAFEIAVEQGAHVLEMDLQLTADDIVVVIHDETVDRTTDGTGRVRDMTLAEIKELETGHDFPGPDGDFPFVGQGVEVPTLREVLEAFPDEWMLIEMKDESGPEIVPATAELIREFGREDISIVASFNLDFIREFRGLIPEIPTNMPEGEARTFHMLQIAGLHRWWQPPAEFLQAPIDFQDFLFFDEFRVITPGFVRAAEHRGVDVHAWTINDPDEMHWLLNMGVHGIITDYPDRFNEVVAERERAAVERADPDLHPGLGFVQGAQDRFEWLTPVMEGVTFLGDEEFYVYAFPLIFWSIHRTVGIALGFLFLVSVSLNAIFKLASRSPRPSFVDPSLALRHESTFGIPSGHAQNAVVVWGYLASALQRWWAWVAAGVVIVLLGLSRLQLGVHFPVDTVVGWGIGVALLVVFLRWHASIGAWVVALSPRRQLWLAFGVSAGFILLAVVLRLATIGWEIPPGWIGMDPANPPTQISSVVTPAATLFGFAAGLVFIRNRGGFSSDGPLWQRAVRYPIGIVGVFVLWAVLGEIFPRGEDLVALLYRYLRYMLIGLWVGGVAPLLFVRLRLASPDSAFTAREPEERVPAAP
jgi:glycerophosphoryl diester phosphodiesterase/membrane-associated phospholipid phosphatase